MRLILILVSALTFNTALAKSSGIDFLQKSLKDSAWIPLADNINKASIYDQALAALAFVASDRMDLAGSILFHLSKQQLSDGALPFYFFENKEKNARYIRSGALAWVGYAASHYLNASAKSLYRKEILAMTHKIANYLLSQQIKDTQDKRHNLITAGEGILARTDNHLNPLDLDWVSTEHNIDAYFFFRDFYKLTQQNIYLKTSDEIAQALKKLWLKDKKHLSQGIDIKTSDIEPALDCASWGGLFFIANKNQELAKLSLKATATFKSFDEATNTEGFKPYIEKMWSKESGVWPEGTAGVALLNHRLGFKKEALEILSQLENLRLENGSLPDFTKKIPFEFDNKSSIAATAWVEFVVQEIRNKKSFKIFGKN